MDLPSDVTSENPDEISLSDNDGDDETSDVPALPHTKSGHKPDFVSSVSKQESSDNPDATSSNDTRSSGISSWLPPPSLHTDGGSKVDLQQEILSENPDEIGLADDEES
jgi:hypothetical protein